jgi:hypothetical protein
MHRRRDLYKISDEMQHSNAGAERLRKRPILKRRRFGWMRFDGQGKNNKGRRTIKRDRDCAYADHASAGGGQPTPDPYPNATTAWPLWQSMGKARRHDGQLHLQRSETARSPEVRSKAPQSPLSCAASVRPGHRRLSVGEPPQYRTARHNWAWAQRDSLALDQLVSMIALLHSWETTRAHLRGLHDH